eukprot:3461987-Pleurochrysis_carterae.AAC.3
MREGVPSAVGKRNTEVHDAAAGGKGKRQGGIETDRLASAAAIDRRQSGGVGSLPERVLPGAASLRGPFGATGDAPPSQQWVARLATSHPTEVGEEW